MKTSPRRTFRIMPCNIRAVMTDLRFTHIFHCLPNTEERLSAAPVEPAPVVNRILKSSHWQP
jgi:hypothetical protein